MGHLLLILILTLVGLGVMNVAGAVVLPLPETEASTTGSNSCSFASTQKRQHRSVDLNRAPRTKAKIKSAAPVRAGGVAAYIFETSFTALHAIDDVGPSVVRVSLVPASSADTRGPPSL